MRSRLKETWDYILFVMGGIAYMIGMLFMSMIILLLMILTVGFMFIETALLPIYYLVWLIFDVKIFYFITN